MMWGETQSVVQLAAALNAIYVSLLDIRNPYVRSQEDALNRLSLALGERMAKNYGKADKDKLASIATEVTDLWVEYKAKIEDFDKKDVWVARFCSLSVATSIVVLIVSTFNYTSGVNSLAFVAGAIFGYAPIVFGFVFNVFLVRSLKGSTQQKRVDTENRLFAFKGAPLAQDAVTGVL